MVVENYVWLVGWLIESRNNNNNKKGRRITFNCVSVKRKRNSSKFLFFFFCLIWHLPLLKLYHRLCLSHTQYSIVFFSNSFFVFSFFWFVIVGRQSSSGYTIPISVCMCVNVNDYIYSFVITYGGLDKFIFILFDCFPSSMYVFVCV